MSRQGEWLQPGIAALGADVPPRDIGLFLSPDGAQAQIGFTLARFAVTGLRALDARNLASVRLLQRRGVSLQARSKTTFRGALCVELDYRRASMAQKQDKAARAALLPAPITASRAAPAAPAVPTP